MSDLLHQQMIPTLPEIAANYQRSIRDRTMSVCLSPEWGGGAIGRAGREASESIGLCQQDCELLYVRLASYSIPPYQRQTESSRMQESKKVARSPRRTHPSQPARQAPARPPSWHLIPSHPTRPSSGRGDRERRQLLRPAEVAHSLAESPQPPYHYRHIGLNLNLEACRNLNVMVNREHFGRNLIQLHKE